MATEATWGETIADLAADLDRIITQRRGLAVDIEEGVPGASPHSACSDSLDRGLAIFVRLQYHIRMVSKTTIVFDDEMEAALEELMALDGTKRLAIKRSLLAEVKRRRRSRALLDIIGEWEACEGPIDDAHLEWADTVLDRQGVDR